MTTDLYSWINHPHIQRPHPIIPTIRALNGRQNTARGERSVTPGAQPHPSNHPHIQRPHPIVPSSSALKGRQNTARGERGATPGHNRRTTPGSQPDAQPQFTPHGATPIQPQFTTPTHQPSANPSLSSPSERSPRSLAISTLKYTSDCRARGTNRSGRSLSPNPCRCSPRIDR